MYKMDITEIRVEPVAEKSGVLGRKNAQEERLCLKTEGGSIFLRKTTLEAIGDSWDRVKNYFVELSQERGIPYIENIK